MAITLYVYINHVNYDDSHGYFIIYEESMNRQKSINVSEEINNYNENFINSISLNDIKNCKELKELLSKLERANYVATSYYEMLYTDYITMINSDCKSIPCSLDVNTLMKYKSLASKIQKAYNYILYVNTFENPFKLNSRK
jgi:hypothetical protein